MFIHPLVLVGLMWRPRRRPRPRKNPRPPLPTPPAARRNLQVDDLFRIKTLGDPQVSPDGKWVAYTVATASLKEDKTETQVWMAPTDGGDPLPMTAAGTSASQPRFSPDGKYLGFLAARPEAGEEKDDAKSQVWLLDRRGGEAQRLTEVPQGVEGFAWAPDGKKLVLLIKDPSAEEIEAQKHKDAGTKPVHPTAPPVSVVDRLQIKRDYEGYLDRRRSHLYVFDLAAKKPQQVTSGDHDDRDPVWSPDGRFLAFVSNHSEDPDANYDSNVWVVAADNPDKGKTLIQVTANTGDDEQPAWSPDGKWLAYVTNPEPKILWYATTHLALLPAPAAGGAKAEPKLLTKPLDRNAREPQFAPDSASIYFRLEDGGEEHVARIPVAGGAVTRPLAGPRAAGRFAVGKDGTIAALVSDPQHPDEVFLLKGGAVTQLTHVNKQFLDEVRLAEYEEVQWKSKDGTAVEGFIVKPPGFSPELKYPALLRIHGGPVSQYDKSFSFEDQLFAANGYVVVLPNPRGSSGYGQEFSRAIFADWGTKDTQDVLAGVDYAIAQGYVDADRLGVGGWSYGGILTNYVISQTDRFKAAISGAAPRCGRVSTGTTTTSSSTRSSWACRWKNRECGSGSRSRTTTWRRSRRPRSSWAAPRTGTCPSSAPSRCTRRYAGSAARRSSWSIPASTTASASRRTRRTASSGTSPGTTRT